MALTLRLTKPLGKVVTGVVGVRFKQVSIQLPTARCRLRASIDCRVKPCLKAMALSVRPASSIRSRVLCRVRLVAVGISRPPTTLRVVRQPVAVLVTRGLQVLKTVLTRIIRLLARPPILRLPTDRGRALAGVGAARVKIEDEMFVM